jgi:tripartite-type tricarboxylate transporter receptor subunit TctC
VKIPAVALALAWCAAASAQSFPTKPIRVVVPTTAGGIDVYLRVVLPKVVEALGQQIVIENRPGASGAIGAENIARSAPDGYSLLFCTSAQIVTAPFITRALPYDPVKDLAPIIKIVEPVETLMVHSGLPVRNVRELIDYAKKNPGKLSYGSSGIGTVPHFDGELFKSAAGIDMVHIPYKGIAQIMPELATGRIEVAFPGIGSAANILSAGKARILAVLDSNRYARMPDLPSITETLPGFRHAPIWFGLFGPSAVPRPVVDRLYGAVSGALKTQEVRDQYEKMTMMVLGSNPEEFAAAIRADTELTAGLVKSIGLKAE